jgi:2-polyprenyl-3-methyl-5-hydroxy-6-metoxy-1,4-benzoquinol methylase
MQATTHWESVYGTRTPEQVSWYRPHLDTSLALIERVAPSHSATIIDIGGGASTLADDLVRRGYANVSVLDLSKTALLAAKERLGTASAQIQWLTADVCEADLLRRVALPGCLPFSNASRAARLLRDKSGDFN